MCAWKTVVVRAVAAVCAVGMVYQNAAGWGDTGHTLVNRIAAQRVPASMPPFFRAASEYLAYMGPEPDRWRNTSEFALKNAQEPDHFIDMERLSDVPVLPEGRYDFYRLLYAKRIAAKSHGDDFIPERVGLQPYAVMEMFGRLKVAMRAYRRMKQNNQPTTDIEHNILLYAGWLGHYVADASNPLHTTIYFDGWTAANPNGYTTTRGIHDLFELRFVDATVSQFSFGDLLHDPVQLQHPFQDYVEYVRDSNRLVEKVYQLEKAGAFKETGTPEGREFLRQRLAAGAQMLLNLWYTAWQESAVAAPAYRGTE